MGPHPLSGRGSGLLNGGKPVRTGRLQSQIRRAFICSNGRPLCIADLLPRCFPAAKRHARWMRKSVHRALPRFAIPLGRIPDRQGRPMIWAPRPEICRLVAKPLPKSRKI
jgi:hypothetical protein